MEVASMVSSQGRNYAFRSSTPAHTVLLATVSALQFVCGVRALNKSKAFVVVLAALLLHGCTTPAPTYKNLKPSPNDAELSFESDFELHTHFSINTQRGSSCGKFETVGYLLKANSIFIYDRPNKEIKVMVPTGKPIGVAGYHYFSDPGYRSNCYPGGHFFHQRETRNM
jgi:hypothetical protein